jgi:glycosyltransferase involved in cell wall biosynthesis
MPAPDRPKISIVTPNFNYAKFLERTLTSVLDQDYPNFEYIVIDDGSTDESVEIIRRHEQRLAHWETGTNRGQYVSISRGFARATGEIFGWLNSDDAYLPGALSLVADIFNQFPRIEWLTTLYPLLWDERGRLVRADHVRGFSRAGFLAGEHLPTPGAYTQGYIQQESTFWRRSLWEKAGGCIDPEFRKGGDFALWAQFYRHAELVGVAAPIAGFRVHGAQLTSRVYDQYHGEAKQALEKYGGRVAGPGWRLLRELAARLPVAMHPLLVDTGLMHRSSMVRWNLAEARWEMVERFI